MIRESLANLKKSSVVGRCYVFDVTSNKVKFSSKCLNKRVLEKNGDGLQKKYRRVLNETVNVSSNIRGFRTNNHSVATYEQGKKVCPTFTQSE